MNLKYFRKTGGRMLGDAKIVAYEPDEEPPAKATCPMLRQVATATGVTPTRFDALSSTG